MLTNHYYSKLITSFSVVRANVSNGTNNFMFSKSHLWKTNFDVFFSNKLLCVLQFSRKTFEHFRKSISSLDIELKTHYWNETFRSLFNAKFFLKNQLHYSIDSYLFMTILWHHCGWPSIYAIYCQFIFITRYLTTGNLAFKWEPPTTFQLYIQWIIFLKKTSSLLVV